jgi:membrane protease YdiL (CAAX protease family)
MTARPAAEALVSAAVVSAVVTLASTALPSRWVASAVGLTFLGATWLLVLRRDDATVEHAGLAFGGLILPEPVDAARVGRDTRQALLLAVALAAIFFAPFYVGFRTYARVVWHAHPGAPVLGALSPLALANDAMGQLALIALPEEAFYRGYLQTRLDDAWPARVRVLGADVGPSLVVTSAVFALGHLLTIHDAGRLAVFFPSLLFGWLRARTGGVGASILFHASCNLFSGALLAAYGPH